MTEFGEIPSEWNINLVKDITTEHKQGYYAKNDYNDNGTYLMRITDLRNQKINFKEMPRIEIDDDIYEQYKVELGDFLFARSGAIGRYGIYDTEDYPQAVFASYIIRFRFNTSNVNNKYFGYFYESNYCLNQLKAITQGSSNININANNIKDLKICLPPLKEQEKIALILSTVDEQIDNVDELIQKNKELKKGLMQQLLTKGIGHTKFKKTEIGEIPEEWDIKKLGDICEVKGGKRLPKGYQLEDENNGFPYIRVADMYMGGIKLEDIKYVPKNIVEKIKNYKISKNDLFISVAGTLGIVGKVPEVLDGANLTENADKLCDIKINKLYLMKVLQSELVQSIIDSEKTTNAQPKLALTRIKEFLIPVPSNEEQKKIAAILSKVDENIEEYENKKQKFEELKKGLMQELLTGKIRVI